MRKIIKKIEGWRKPIYQIGLAMGLLLFLQQLWSALSSIREYFHLSWLFYIIVAILGIFLTYFIQMFSWAQLMSSIGSSLKAIGVIRGYIISFIPRYIPGTVWGYLSRNEWLLQNYKIPYSTSTLGSVLEISIGLLTAGMVVLGCYMWPKATIGGKIIWLFMAVVVILSVWYMLNLNINFLRRKFFPDLTTQSIRLKNWAVASTMYLFFWFFHGTVLLWLLKTLANVNTDLYQTTFVYSLSWLIGFLILIAPAGLGVRELALSTLLVKQFQMSPDIASLIAVTSRFTIYSAEIIWLAIAGIFSKILQIGDLHHS